MSKALVREATLEMHPVYNLVLNRIFGASKKGEFKTTIFGDELNCLIGKNRERTEICYALINHLQLNEYDVRFDDVNKILKIEWW